MTETTETGPSAATGLITYLADVGRCLMRELGFEMTGLPDVKADIGTEDPGHARLTLTWPLPAGLCDEDEAGCK